jgi:hypothetical protein
MQFTELIGRLKFDDELLEWVRNWIHPSPLITGYSS